MYEEKFMREAIRLAVENVKQGTGGPFGAVVVKEGKIIAACANTVTPDCDPTAHAEVNAIREACRKLDSFFHSTIYHLIPLAFSVEENMLGVIDDTEHFICIVIQE